MTSNGVIRVLSPKDRSWYAARDVQQLLGVGRSKAYSVIKSLRAELIESNEMSPEYPQGKIPKEYFNTRMCICTGGKRNERVKKEKAC